MNDFLKALKDDLLDRRFLPLLALGGIAVVAAIAYVVLSGGSSESTPTASVTPPVAGTTGIAVTQSSGNPNEAVAETTNGASAQRKGVARDPFTPLPGALKATTTPGASSTAASSGTGVSTKGAAPEASSPSTGTAPSKPSPTPEPSKPSPPKPTTVYHVAVLFGAVPLAPNTQLTPYENLKLLTPLPSATQALVVFRGVTSGGQAASFTVVGEAILHGSAVCTPSPSQCQEIELKSDQTEQLEYITSSGAPVTYELHVVSITSDKASAARVASVVHGASNAGRQVLQRVGLVSVEGLHFSSQAGVLLLAANGSGR